MSIDYASIRDAILTKASNTGGFVQVIDHDPLSAPNEPGLVVSFIGMGIAPIQASGMSSASIRAEFVIRVMLNGLLDPPGQIDFLVMSGADAVMGALAADSRLGGVANVRCVDVFGMAGEPMRCITGWTDIAQTKFRIADIYVPILINDCWDLG